MIRIGDRPHTLEWANSNGSYEREREREILLKKKRLWLTIILVTFSPFSLKKRIAHKRTMNYNKKLDSKINTPHIQP